MNIAQLKEYIKNLDDDVELYHESQDYYEELVCFADKYGRLEFYTKDDASKINRAKESS